MGQTPSSDEARTAAVGPTLLVPSCADGGIYMKDGVHSEGNSAEHRPMKKRASYNELRFYDGSDASDRMVGFVSESDDSVVGDLSPSSPAASPSAEAMQPPMSSMMMGGSCYQPMAWLDGEEVLERQEAPRRRPRPHKNEAWMQLGMTGV